MRGLHLAYPRTLAAGTRNHLRTSVSRLAMIRPASALLLLVQDQLKNIIRKLRELEAHSLELRLGVVTQGVAARGPECSNGLPDSRILWVALLVYVAGVRELALGSGCGTVNLRVREGLEVGKLQAVGQCVDLGMYEQAESFVVGRRLTWVSLQGSVPAR